MQTLFESLTQNMYSNLGYLFPKADITSICIRPSSMSHLLIISHEICIPECEQIVSVRFEKTGTEKSSIHFCILVYDVKGGQMPNVKILMIRCVRDHKLIFSASIKIVNDRLLSGFESPYWSHPDLVALQDIALCTLAVTVSLRGCISKLLA